MAFLQAFSIFSAMIFLLTTVFYGYQIGYILISIIFRKVKPLPETDRMHRFAVMISARNEEGVIFELLDSLQKQNYPKDMYDVYVIADNCTDNTAEISRKHGATVIERFNNALKGKGYALNDLYHEIITRNGHDYYDAYVVFDADNLVDSEFLKEVNKKLALGGYDALTTYRNSKNFSTNWLSAAYSIWFMHEARHLNYIRDLLGAQCMISGTGFVVSEKVMKSNDGWPYYFLTEDIQFSVASTLQGYRIGYVDSAIIFDEQPSSMKQSWNQRLRWAKGFYQIDLKYLMTLGSAFFKVKGWQKKLSIYDVMMTCLPCTLLTVCIVGIALFVLLGSLYMPYYVRLLFQKEMFLLLGTMFYTTWFGMMILSIFTVVSEWKRIPATNSEKLIHIWIFPLYMLSYIPITIQALFTKVTWKPIQHYSTAELAARYDNSPLTGREIQ